MATRRTLTWGAWFVIIFALFASVRSAHAQCAAGWWCGDGTMSVTWECGCPGCYGSVTVNVPYSWGYGDYTSFQCYTVCCCCSCNIPTTNPGGNGYCI